MMISKRLLLALLCLTFSFSATAAPKSPKGGSSFPEIYEVFYNSELFTLTILGDKFDPDLVEVRLGDSSSDPLPFYDLPSSSDLLVVDVTGVADGDYTLTVTQGDDGNQADQFDLTIGAVGPKGPQGEQGEQGPAGLGCAITQCSVLGTAVITCGTSPSVEIPCTRAKFVFVSSTLTTGALGGVSGGDAICNADAAVASLPGVYTAWLSTSTENAKDRISPSALGWQRPDGVLVATDIADLTDSSIAASISVLASGAAIGLEGVHTGTKADGTVGPFTCGDWTLGGSNGGTRGIATFTNSRWTINGATEGSPCGSPKRLYCFEQ